MAVRNRKVLVVEDENSIRDFVVINLRRAGYEVVDVDSVMDGNLDGFINAYLSGQKAVK